MKLLILLNLAWLEAVWAQQPAYGQCGGTGWTGSKTCTSGYYCAYSNEYYSQCLPGTGSTTLSTSAAPSTSTSRPTTTSAAAAASFTNPVLWEDLADLEVIRVGDVFYYTASTMHYSPGAPVLRSYDLVNWEFIGHSVPVLDWSPKYNLANGQRAYVKGIWASTLNYRPSNKLFYWIGCIEFGTTYVYTAPAATGPWTRRSSINTCYYDAGLLVDDNDKMYVAYGNTQLSVAELSADGLSQVRTQVVYNTPSNIGTLEGARFYKVNGNYYIFVTRPANAEYVLKSTSGPFGPYSIKVLVNNIVTPVPGSGYPHQGGIVSTPNGAWYYMSFIDNYPGGRVPVLAPITWGSDGFPTLTTVNGGWGASYPYPLPARPVKSPAGTDSFSGTSLGPEWEWNHNPDNSKFSVNNGLTLSTATVTNDLYAARNTLTHRILGPSSTATIILSYVSMQDGDRAGFVLLRDSSAWIGVVNNGGSFRVTMWNGLTMDTNWNTSNAGREAAGAAISGGRIWLRIAADIRPGTGRQAKFSYSTDGSSFQQLGPAFTMNSEWRFFMGYRYGIFNHATKALGGSVKVASFTMVQP